MREQDSYGNRFAESSGGLFFPGRELPTEQDLNRIFGVDCRVLTERGFIEMGVLKKGQRLPFLNPPKRHIYQHKLADGTKIEVVSQAIYFVDMVVGDHALMASFVPENSEATEHYHIYGIREHYTSIAGRAHLRLEEGVIDLGDNNRRYTVEERTIHRFSTNSSPAFTSLVMENAGRVSRDKWHILTDSRKVL